MSKKKIILIAGGVITLAALIFAAYKLYDGINSFSAAEQKLDVSMRALKRYYAMNPFPSDQNIKIESDNITTLNDWFVTLVSNLKKGEILPEKEKSPSRFMKLLDLKKRGVEKLAGENRTKLAEGNAFAMGFESYFKEGSELPTPDDVPRLTQQLIIIEKVCNILLEEGASEIGKIVRENFSGTGGEESGDLSSSQNVGRRRVGAGRNRATNVAGAGSDSGVFLYNKDAGLMGPADLYAKLHFVVAFKMGEKAFLGLLNRLAQDPMFIVVTSVTIEKQGDDIRMPSSEEKKNVLADGKDKDSEKSKESVVQQPKEKEPALSRQQKQVSGLEFEKPLSVVLEFDVCRFRGDEQN